MASLNKPTRTQVHEPNTDTSALLDVLVDSLVGNYDVDAKLGNDPRNTTNPAHVDTTALAKKIPTAFPLKVWGYDGIETQPLDDTVKTPATANDQQTVVNTDEYAFSVMSRETEQQKTFALFRFDGYDDAGNILKEPIVALEQNQLKASPDGTSPMESVATVDTIQAWAKDWALKYAVPKGTMVETTLTRAQILALPGGWAPCDGGNYLALDGTYITVPDRRGLGSRCATTDADIGVSFGSDTINIQHQHTCASHYHNHYHNHGHNINGDVSLTASSGAHGHAGSSTGAGNHSHNGTHNDGSHGHGNDDQSPTWSTISYAGGGNTSPQFATSAHQHNVPTGSSNHAHGIDDSGDHSHGIGITDAGSHQHGLNGHNHGGGTGNNTTPQTDTGLVYDNSTGLSSASLSTTQSVVNAHKRYWVMIKL